MSAMSVSQESDGSLTEMDFGNFFVPDLLNTSENCMNDDSFDEILSGNVEIVASDNVDGETQKMLRALQIFTNDEEILSPEMPSSAKSTSTFLTSFTQTNGDEKSVKRFKSISDKEMKEIESSAQSKNTQKNTAWGVRIFQDWNTEVYGCPTDLETVTPEILATKLAKFYCEATPKHVNKRRENLPQNQADVYHKNSMINIRAAINRHLQDLHRDIDLVRDKQFKVANKTLDGLLKSRLRNGMSRATQHKKIIPQNDLNKINTYLQGAPESPYILRQAVWYNIAIHFVSRGLEFHKQLRRDSFHFSTDEHGEYAFLNHEVQQKNYQGGLSKNEGENTKRMYAVVSAGQQCPVALLKLLIEKTAPSAPMLFNQYVKNARPNDKIWFVNKPLSPRTFSVFMPEICKASSVEKYTAHCLRATAITAMNDSGFEAGHIMFMSGHRSEMAIRSYNRSCTDQQKKAFSETLSNLASGGPVHDTSQQNNENLVPDLPLVPRPCAGIPCAPRAPSHMITQSVTSDDTYSLIPVTSEKHVVAESVMSNYTSTGMLTNSVFHGCTFNFNTSK